MADFVEFSGLISLQCHHCSTMGKVSQRVWKWASTQERLFVKNHFYINTEKTNSFSFGATATDLLKVQSIILLLIQPFVFFSKGVRPRRTSFGVINTKIIPSSMF